MKLRLRDIPREGKELRVEVISESLNERLKGGQVLSYFSDESPSERSKRRGQLGSAEGSAQSVEFINDAIADLKAELEASTVLLTGFISFEFKTPCSRCAEATEQSLSFKLQLVLKKAAPTLEPSNEQDEDLGLAFYTNEEVNLSEIVEEHVMLNIPSYILCSEECQGLCQQCGCNLNNTSCRCEQSEPGDERFAVLKNLKLN